MPLSNASRLADFGTGIGTAGAIIQVDNVNQRLGVGTTAPTATLGVAGIVSATAFYGDGSNLDGVASAGLGTALSETEFDPLTVIYQTSDTLSVGATITVDPPDATTKVAYTQYADIKLEDDADLIIADGDDFIPDILGLSTEGFSFNNANGNGVFDTVYTDNIERADGRGAPNFPLGITVSGISTLSGNVSIGGTLTYEDVTNVDSIGIVTARDGIDSPTNLVLRTGGTERVRITSAGLGIGIAPSSSEGSELSIKGTDGGTNVALVPNANTEFSQISFYNASFDSTQGYIKYNNNDNSLQVRVNLGERLRIGNAGQIGIGGANYGTSGQVITSQGGSAAPQWATPSGGLSMSDTWYLRPHTNASVSANYGSIVFGDWATSTNNLKYIRYEEQYGFSNVGAAMTVSSSGVWTFPATGVYQVNTMIYFQDINNSNRGRTLYIETSIDNGSSYNRMAGSRYVSANSNAKVPAYTSLYAFNVTNTSTHKVRLQFNGGNDVFTSYIDGSKGADYYGLERNINFQKIS